MAAVMVKVTMMVVVVIMMIIIIGCFYGCKHSGKNTELACLRT